jgi:hypothetical protein
MKIDVAKRGAGRIYSRNDLCAGRSAYWIKVKNPNAPAVKREAEEDWN